MDVHPVSMEVVLGLSGSSSRQEVLRVYKDNADYDLLNSPAKAQLFIQACRILLATPVKRSESAARGEAVELDLTIVERQKKEAERWWRMVGQTGRRPGQLVEANLSDFREGYYDDRDGSYS